MSLTGTWGSEKLTLNTKLPKDHPRASSCYLLNFSEEQLSREKKIEDANQYAKFSKVKASSPTVMKYSTEYLRQANNFGNESNGGSMMGTPSITSSEAVINEFKNSMKMSRTASKRLHTMDAPIAIGRSGPRPDVGKSTSGLLGEVFCESNEPGIDTITQRKWLYQPDPALFYKKNGIPEAYMPNDVSLAIGEEDIRAELKATRSRLNLPEPEVNSGSVKRFPRTAVLTADVMSKTGAARAGIFRDDADSVIDY